MAVQSFRYTEYWVECDVCGSEDVVHSGDIGCDGTTVSSKSTAMKALGYHNSKGRCLCDDCYRLEKAHGTK